MKTFALIRKRRLLAAGVAAALGMSAWVAVGGADGRTDEAAGTVQTVTVAAQSDPAADDGDGELAAPTAVTYEIYLSRDPFEPVIAAASDDNGGGGGGGGGSDDPCTSSDSEAVCDGIVVELIGIDPQTGDAIIRVGGADYMVGVGDEFADSFRVLAIDPPCVTLLYGDDSFTLCEGERVLK